MYIDGFNLYHSIAAYRDHQLKWLNLWRLSETFLRRGETLDEVNFFTAVLNWAREKQRRHRNYLAALRAVGVNVHEANFKTARRHCEQTGFRCKFHEEKQTDVAIAVKVVSDVVSSAVDRVILMTADSDQIPVVRFLIKDYTSVKLTLVFPPGRKSQARELGSLIPDHHELSVGRIWTCPLPRTVFDSLGRPIAHMPALYNQD